MDPLTAIGAVASICQLAQTALSLSKTLYTLGSAVASASDDVRILADDLKTFSQSLTLLSRLLEDSKSWYSDDIYLLTAKIIKDCAELYVKTDKVLSKLGGNGKSSWKTRVKFVYKEGEIRKLLKRLRDMKGTLATILMSLQVDLQLSLLNIASGSSQTRSNSEKALQPETIQTLRHAQQAVELGSFLPEYTTTSKDIASASGEGVRISSTRYEQLHFTESHVTVAGPPKNILPTQSQQPTYSPFVSCNVMAIAPIDLDTYIARDGNNSGEMAVKNNELRRTSTSDWGVKSLKSVSSTESFKSAISVQDADLDIARNVKAVQSVLHAFRTALQTLQIMVDRRLHARHGRIYHSAKHLESSLYQYSNEIERVHMGHFKVHGARYIDAFTNENSNTIQNISVWLMQNVVLKLHEISAEYEQIQPDTFQTLQNSSTEAQQWVLRHLTHLSGVNGNTWGYGTVHQARLNGQIPRIEQPEMSLPFIGYTFKRFDAMNGYRDNGTKPTPKAEAETPPAATEQQLSHAPEISTGGNVPPTPSTPLHSSSCFQSRPLKEVSTPNNDANVQGMRQDNSHRLSGSIHDGTASTVNLAPFIYPSNCHRPQTELSSGSFDLVTTDSLQDFDFDSFLSNDDGSAFSFAIDGESQVAHPSRPSESSNDAKQHFDQNSAVEPVEGRLEAEISSQRQKEIQAKKDKLRELRLLREARQAPSAPGNVVIGDQTRSSLNELLDAQRAPVSSGLSFEKSHPKIKGTRAHVKNSLSMDLADPAGGVAVLEDFDFDSFLRPNDDEEHPEKCSNDEADALRQAPLRQQKPQLDLFRCVRVEMLVRPAQRDISSANNVAGGNAPSVSLALLTDAQKAALSGPVQQHSIERPALEAAQTHGDEARPHDATQDTSKAVPGSSQTSNHALQDYQMELLRAEQEQKKRPMAAREEARLISASANDANHFRAELLQSPARANHALYDYEDQLVLLEQQNRRRLMMARQEQESSEVPSTTNEQEQCQDAVLMADETMRIRYIQPPTLPTSVPVSPEPAQINIDTRPDHQLKRPNDDLKLDDGAGRRIINETNEAIADDALTILLKLDPARKLKSPVPRTSEADKKAMADYMMSLATHGNCRSNPKRLRMYRVDEDPQLQKLDIPGPNDKSTEPVAAFDLNESDVLKDFDFDSFLKNDDTDMPNFDLGPGPPQYPVTSDGSEMHGRPGVFGHIFEAGTRHRTSSPSYDTVTAQRAHDQAAEGERLCEIIRKERKLATQRRETESEENRLFRMQQAEQAKRRATDLVEASALTQRNEEIYKIRQQAERTSVSQASNNEKPLYINNKQFHRILKRRVARSELEKASSSAETTTGEVVFSSAGPDTVQPPKSVVENVVPKETTKTAEAPFIGRTWRNFSYLPPKHTEQDIAEQKAIRGSKCDYCRSIGRPCDYHQPCNNCSDSSAVTRECVFSNPTSMFSIGQEVELAWSSPALSPQQTTRLWWQAYISFICASSGQSPVFSTLESALASELDYKSSHNESDEQICKRIVAEVKPLSIAGSTLQDDRPELREVLGLRGEVVRVLMTVDQRLNLETATLAWGCVGVFLSIFKPLLTPTNSLSPATITQLTTLFTHLNSITTIIARYTVMENLYQQSITSSTLTTLSLKPEYQSSLLSLCSSILEWFAASFTVGKLLVGGSEEDLERVEGEIERCKDLTRVVAEKDRGCRIFRVEVDGNVNGEEGLETDSDWSEESWEEVDGDEVRVGVL